VAACAAGWGLEGAGGDEGAAEPLKGVRLLRVGAEHNGVGAELRGCGWREGPAGHTVGAASVEEDGGENKGEQMSLI